MKQQTFDQHQTSKRVIAAAVIMSMTRLGLIQHQQHADDLFADMMRTDVAELEAARTEYERRIEEREKKAKLAGGTGR